MIENIIDLNCWFGNHYLSEELSVDEKKLKGYHDYLQTVCKNPVITLSSYYSLFCDPVGGDEELGEFIAGYNFLSGCLIFPNCFISREDEFVSYLEKKYLNGFRFLRIYPKTHKYLADARSMGSIYNILDMCSFPLVINIDEIDITGNKVIDWTMVMDISDRFPNIPIILDGGNAKELMFNGYFFQLLENCSNLFLESHNLLAFNQVEDISGKFGASRILLGSNFTVYPAFLSVERIIFARIEDIEKKKILADNARGLIEGIDFERIKGI